MPDTPTINKPIQKEGRMMARILVLTKNVLAEVDLQNQLQNMNYEVMVSSEFYYHLCYKMPIEQELGVFQLFLFSETLTDEEVEAALPILVATGKPIVQRVDCIVEKEKWLDWQRYSGIHFSEVDLSPRDFKQKLEDCLEEYEEPYPSASISAAYATQHQDNVRELLTLFHETSFTKLELKILDILYRAHGKIVTKETLCNELWGEEVNKSRGVQIYTNIGRIKEKFHEIYPDKQFIASQRGVGYYLTPAFYEMFSLDVAV